MFSLLRRSRRTNSVHVSLHPPLSSHLNSAFDRCFLTRFLSIFSQRMSVRNFLRRQTDVNHLPSHSRSHQNHNSSNLERPLSEYDNIKTTVAPSTTTQTHFPLGDIKFRFDDLPLTATIMNNSSHSTTSAVHCNNNHDDKQTTTLPAHQYENVLDTLQMRNKRESDQQVNEQRSPLPQQRSVMSDAKSSFFGLNSPPKSSTQDEFDRLIADISNTQITVNDRNQYVNLMPNPADESKSSNEKVSTTSSASGSSSTTVTPSCSPTRQDRTGSSRKNSEGSNRSKSPKFMLPEMTSPASPSQVIFFSENSVARWLMHKYAKWSCEGKCN